MLEKAIFGKKKTVKIPTASPPFASGGWGSASRPPRCYFRLPF